MSGGRLILNVHPGNEIVPVYEQTEAVRDGVLHMAHSDLGAEMALVGKAALLLGASGYPAGTTCDEDFSWFYLGDGMDYASKVFEDYGLVIGCLPEGQRHICQRAVDVYVTPRRIHDGHCILLGKGGSVIQLRLRRTFALRAYARIPGWKIMLMTSPITPLSTATPA